MTHTFDTVGYRDVANEVNHACEWLCDNGLDYLRTRVGRYRKHLNELAGYWEEGRIDEFIKLRDFESVMNSCHEAAELVYIFKGLSSYLDASLKNKLQQFIKGPFASKDENHSSSNRGRNIAFELYMAAKFAKAGFTVDLTSDADVIVSILGHEVFVECKRPQKNEQINSNIKGALRQLQGRYSTAKCPEMARGIVAIAIGKVFNPDLRLVTASTPESLSGKVSAINEAFLKTFDPKWRNPDDSRTIGALIYLGIPAEIQTLNLLTNCHEFAIKTTFRNNYGLDILTEIRNRIHPAD